MTTGEPRSSSNTDNTVEYDANKNGVDSVTVFQTNRAEVWIFIMERTYTDHDESKVRRKIEVVLRNGQKDVEIKNLPTFLEEDSIRVDGIGNATIFDFIYR